MNGFYPETIDYPNLPDDLISITDDLYKQLLIGQNSGKLITPNGSEAPYLSEPAPPTAEQLMELAESELNRLISAANAYMSDRQWPGKAAIGRLKGDELAQYNLWLDYLDALYAVDTSLHQGIEWPTMPSQNLV